MTWPSASSAPADKVVRDGLDRFIAQRYPKGGRTQFIQALGTYGVSEDDVLGEFRRLLETRSLFQAVTADVTGRRGADREEPSSERKDQLAVPDQRHLRHLVVKPRTRPRRPWPGSTGPETFEGVAKDVSLDTSTKDKGGDLGTVSRAQLDPAFGEAAFAAAAGATFGPVMTKNGWHVGLVEEVTPGHPVTLAEVHDPLRDTLVAEAAWPSGAAYLADRIRTADACYAKGNRPADPKAAARRHHPQHPERPTSPATVRRSAASVRERRQPFEEGGGVAGHPQQPAVAFAHESFGDELVEEPDQRARRSRRRRGGRSVWRGGRAATTS